MQCLWHVLSLVYIVFIWVSILLYISSVSCRVGYNDYLYVIKDCKHSTMFFFTYGSPITHMFPAVAINKVQS